MKLLKSLAAAAATMFVASNAHAVIYMADRLADLSPTPGDIAALDLFSDEVFATGTTGTVVDGTDLSVFGVDFYDVNAGPEGNLITADVVGTYSGVFTGGTIIEFLFTLPLPTNVEVTNVEVISTQYAEFGVAWLGNLVLFGALEGPIADGSWFVLDVTYSEVSAVPVPAAALLFAPAAFLAARRRKAKAA